MTSVFRKTKENELRTELDRREEILRKEIESLERRMNARIKSLQSKINQKEDINHSRPTSPSHWPNH